MKTIEQIDEEIFELTRACLDPKLKSNKKEKNKKRISQIKQYRKYLESGAKEEHLTRQHQELHDNLFKIMDGYDVWKKENDDLIAGCVDVAAMKAKYRKKWAF